MLGTPLGRTPAVAQTPIVRPLGGLRGEGDAEWCVNDQRALPNRRIKQSPTLTLATAPTKKISRRFKWLKRHATAFGRLIQVGGASQACRLRAAQSRCEIAALFQTM